MSLRYEGNNQVSWSERPSARMYHSYPNEARNTSSGIVRNHEVSPIWLACSLIAARFHADERPDIDDRRDPLDRDTDLQLLRRSLRLVLEDP